MTTQERKAELQTVTFLYREAIKKAVSIGKEIFEVLEGKKLVIMVHILVQYMVLITISMYDYLKSKINEVLSTPELIAE